MNNFKIRRARIDDISSCLDIYNYEVVNGVATLDLEPRTLPEWQEWYEAHQISEHCIFVGIMDEDYRGKGVASKLMAHILEHAKEMDTLHTVVSVITAGNAASTALHERFGFTYCGLTPQVGFKHGKYQDTETYALLV